MGPVLIELKAPMTPPLTDHPAADLRSAPPGPAHSDPTRSAQHRALMATTERAASGLAGRSREIEARRSLPPDIADALAQAGLYRLLTPSLYGGHEAAPASYFLLIERLARSDAAAAWCCFIANTTCLNAAFLPDAEARPIFSAPLLKAAGVFAPRGQAVPAVQDGVAGLRVTGRWAWGSGTHNADIVVAGCLLLGTDGQPALSASDAAAGLPGGAPRVLSVLLERSQVRLLDNWDSFGLCGTGSGEFEVQNAFVPLGRSASLLDGPRLGTPLYRFPVFGLLALSIAAVATGIALQTLADFVAQASHSVPQASSKPLASKATVQDAVARAQAALQSARAYLLASIAAAWEAAQEATQGWELGAGQDATQAKGHASGSLPLALRRDLRLAASHAVQTSADVVGRLYRLAGGGAVFASSPLQRALRDVQVATQHMMVNDASFELTGRLLLGLPTQTAML